MALPPTTYSSLACCKNLAAPIRLLESRVIIAYTCVVKTDLASSSNPSQNRRYPHSAFGSYLLSLFPGRFQPHPKIFRHAFWRDTPATRPFYGGIRPLPSTALLSFMHTWTSHNNLGLYCGYHGLFWSIKQEQLDQLADSLSFGGGVSLKAPNC